MRRAAARLRLRQPEALKNSPFLVGIVLSIAALTLEEFNFRRHEPRGTW
jgi:hypothetical protein